MQKAAAFTNEYLSLIEERLAITWAEDEPVFIPARINEFSIRRLESELEELFQSELRSNDAVIAIGADSKEIVTSVAFGMASDFDQLGGLGIFRDCKQICGATRSRFYDCFIQSRR